MHAQTASDLNCRIISTKLLWRYFVAFSFLLVSGYLLQTYVFIIPLLVVFFLLLIRRNYTDVLLFIILWTFIYHYYIGQGWVRNELVIRFLLKPNLYVILTSLLYWRKFIPSSLIEKRIIHWTFAAMVLLLANNIFHSRISWHPITYPVFIFVFLLVLKNSNNDGFDKKLLNLLLAIGLMQVLISILQVNDIISRPVWIESAIETYQIGLSDAASGTMGQSRSNVTSWICTILFTFFFSLSLERRDPKYALLSFIFLLQYATVDSKTAIFITLFGILYLLFKYKNRVIKYKENLATIILLLLLIFFGSYLLRNYYTSKLDVSLESRIERIRSATDFVRGTPEDWGKLTGYISLTEQFASGNNLGLIFGHGFGIFGYSYLESYDPVNVTNAYKSWSTFLRYYGEFGIPGLILLIWLFIIIRKDIKYRHYVTQIGKSYQKSGIVILDISVIFMFVYAGHYIRDEAFLLFLLLHALVVRNNRVSLTRLLDDTPLNR